MTKITQSYLLRCGFEYNLVKNIKPEHRRKYRSLTKDHKNIWRFYFTNTIWQYDAELDGEVEIEVLCFKTFGAWAFSINAVHTNLTTIDEMQELLQIYPDENLNFIYIIESKMGFKIGRSKNIDNRGSVFNVKLPFEWEFYKIFAIKKTKKMEKFLHFVLRNYHQNGEWFDLKYQDLPAIEVFVLDNSLQ